MREGEERGEEERMRGEKRRRESVKVSHTIPGLVLTRCVCVCVLALNRVLSSSKTEHHLNSRHSTPPLPSNPDAQQSSSD